MLPSPVSDQALCRGLLAVLIRAGLIAWLVRFCSSIFHPIRNPMFWQWVRDQSPGSRPGIPPQN